MSGFFRRTALAACAALLVGAIAPAAQAAPAAPPPARLQALLDELVANGASGAYALVNDGSGTTRLASGAATLAPRRALEPDARVRAGSITKTFTATVALQLVGERRLALEDTVERWLPGLVPNGDRITVRQLLNHTSGLYNYTDEDFATQLFTQPKVYRAPRELVALSTAQPPLFPPGKGWSYSNTNFILVGLIAQAVTGRRVGELIHDRIIAPLNLTSTSFPTFTWKIDGPHAHGYYPPSLTGAGYVDVTAISASWAGAAGALVSNGPDLQRFYRALLSGELLAPAQLREMQTTVDVDPTFGYGLGLYAQRSVCGTAWGHDGSVPGYATFAFNDRAGRRSVVLAVPTQLDARLGPLTQLTLDTAICQMFGRSTPAPGARTPGHPLPDNSRLTS
ncbi:MAG TPA: serine hydrolase domain-containing protein [Mycobacteriales bacterium]|jgi:D-alanyl-D-alanine carboxypeptidase|nr:serine hydrolase domain-containing protein [Mycobacteriales bacterium]